MKQIENSNSPYIEILQYSKIYYGLGLTSEEVFTRLRAVQHFSDRQHQRFINSIQTISKLAPTANRVLSRENIKQIKQFLVSETLTIELRYLALYATYNIDHAIEYAKEQESYDEAKNFMHDMFLLHWSLRFIGFHAQDMIDVLKTQNATDIFKTQESKYVLDVMLRVIEKDLDDGFYGKRTVLSKRALENTKTLVPSHIRKMFTEALLNHKREIDVDNVMRQIFKLDFAYKE